jgi:hypothetical protein
MRLNLDFDVLVDGDRLTGHSKAGRLPRSAVTGTRRGDLTPRVWPELSARQRSVEIHTTAVHGRRYRRNPQP